MNVSTKYQKKNAVFDPHASGAPEKPKWIAIRSGNRGRSTVSEKVCRSHPKELVKQKAALAFRCVRFFDRYKM
ncbi:hypothetical protein INT08_06605 [Prosthecochloris sp. N3]|uniref:Uncharacterized protein n=1 Tax=Prosthecochloris ethylica TaxID=2743976 RepID=A0ABR9XS57_9CHLB|nr:hypothetical protein [Prosthecochloris ethylica]MBF0585307.1 hypothetical protein [Prosthecochloris ethylica]MBF0636843.1 hypothetical protein [Prosthecochloris ethylica]NUK46536.1 hypothetical protein [Prosthecochloris ethylica]